MTLSRRLLCMTNVALLSASVYATAPDFSDAGSVTAPAVRRVSWNGISVTCALAAVASYVAYNDAEEVNRMMEMNIHGMYYGGVAAVLVVGAALCSGQLYATTPASSSADGSRSSVDKEVVVAPVLPSDLREVLASDDASPERFRPEIALQDFDIDRIGKSFDNQFRKDKLKGFSYKSNGLLAKSTRAEEEETYIAEKRRLYIEEKKREFLIQASLEHSENLKKCASSRKVQKRDVEAQLKQALGEVTRRDQEIQQLKVALNAKQMVINDLQGDTESSAAVTSAPSVDDDQLSNAGSDRSQGTTGSVMNGVRTSLYTRYPYIDKKTLDGIVSKFLRELSALNRENEVAELRKRAEEEGEDEYA